MAIERVDLDAKNFAPKNFAKSLDAASSLGGLGGDPKGLHFVVRHARRLKCALICDHDLSHGRHTGSNCNQSDGQSVVGCRPVQARLRRRR